MVRLLRRREAILRSHDGVDVLTNTDDRGPLIHLTVDTLETEAHVRSISASGLAVLGIADPRDALKPLLAQTLDRGDPLHLAVTAATGPVLVDASLVWFENLGQGDPDGDRIELFVDGSESPRWGELLALSRMPR